MFKVLQSYAYLYSPLSLNPVIYATTNRDFRRPFREYIHSYLLLIHLGPSWFELLKALELNQIKLSIIKGEILCFRCSTLDDLMRREFYDHQYGGDEYCVRNKKKLPGVGSSCVSGGGPLSPTSVSETNILTNNTKINNTNSTSCPSLPPPPPPPPPQLESFPNKQNSVSQTHTPIKLQNQNAISSTTTDQESSGLPQKGSPQWTPSAERNKMNITLETTDPETDVESDGFNCRMVAIWTLQTHFLLIIIVGRESWRNSECWSSWFLFITFTTTTFATSFIALQSNCTVEIRIIHQFILSNF